MFAEKQKDNPDPGASEEDSSWWEAHTKES